MHFFKYFFSDKIVVEQSPPPWVTGTGSCERERQNDNTADFNSRIMSISFAKYLRTLLKGTRFWDGCHI